jgi:hypothetical protein
LISFFHFFFFVEGIKGIFNSSNFSKDQGYFTFLFEEDIFHGFYKKYKSDFLEKKLKKRKINFFYENLNLTAFFRFIKIAKNCFPYIIYIQAFNIISPE